MRLNRIHFPASHETVFRYVSIDKVDLWEWMDGRLFRLPVLICLDDIDTLGYLILHELYEREVTEAGAPLPESFCGPTLESCASRHSYYVLVGSPGPPRP